MIFHSLAVGTVIQHLSAPQWGQGRVMRLLAAGSIEVEFEQAGAKALRLDLAELEVVEVPENVAIPVASQGKKAQPPQPAAPHRMSAERVAAERVVAQRALEALKNQAKAQIKRR